MASLNRRQTRARVMLLLPVVPSKAKLTPWAAGMPASQGQRGRAMRQPRAGHWRLLTDASLLYLRLLFGP